MFLYDVGWGLPNNWSILLYLKQPEHQRILAMDFSAGYLADKPSVGQVCALKLLVDHYDRIKLGQRAHSLAYSVTYKTQAAWSMLLTI
jgi:hypothetical protein